MRSCDCFRALRNSRALRHIPAVLHRWSNNLCSHHLVTSEERSVNRLLPSGQIIAPSNPQAPNNGECDNACQLAHAFNKTGVYSLTSVCFVPAFYAASGTAAAGGAAVINADEVVAATAGDYATWYGRAVSWLNNLVGRTPKGPSVVAAATAAASQVSQFCSSH